ncbi:MAG: hypothetical protein M1347_07400 [Chloroflexi bacterium]|nr:hypothetical protein [Chloroflexota bacterium]
MKNPRNGFRWIGVVIAAVLFAFSFGIENGHASELLQGVITLLVAEKMPISKAAEGTLPI